MSAPAGSDAGSVHVRTTAPPESPGLSLAIRFCGRGRSGGGVAGASMGAANTFAARKSPIRVMPADFTGAEPRGRYEAVSTQFSPAEPHDGPGVDRQGGPSLAEEPEEILHPL